VAFYVTFFETFDYIIVTIRLCQTLEISLWKGVPHQSLSVGFEHKGEGSQVPASVLPYFFYLMGVTKIMMDCVGSNVSNFNRLWVWEILSDSDYNWYGANNGLSGNILEFLNDQTQNLGLLSDNDVIINHLVSDCLSD